MKQTQAALKAIGYAIKPSDLRNAVKDAVKPVVQMASANIPRGDRTKPHNVSSKGSTWEVYPPYAATTLKSKAKIHKDKGGASARVGVVHPAYYAAQFVEFGTKHQEAQPWLQPAFIGTATEQKARLTKWFQRLLKRVRKRQAK